MYKNYEKSIAEVNTLYSGSGGLLDSTKEFIALQSKTYGQSQASNAKAYYQIVSAGITNQAEANKLLDAANKAAIAGLSDSFTAVDALTSVLNVYGDSGVDAAKASDILFSTIKAGKTTFPELAHSLGQVLPTAQAAGLSFEEVGAAIASLTTKGLKTDQAVTQLKGVLRSLIKPTQDAQKAASKLGLDWSTNALKADGFVETLRNLFIATNGNEQAIGKIIPNIRGLGAIFAFARDKGESFDKILKQTKESVGATDDAFSDMAGTLDKKIKVALAANEDRMLKLGKTLKNTKLAWIQLKGSMITFLDVSTKVLGRARMGAANYLADLKAVQVYFDLISDNKVGRAVGSFIFKAANKLGLRQQVEIKNFKEVQKELNKGTGSAKTTSGSTRKTDAQLKSGQQIKKEGAFISAAREATKAVATYYDQIVLKVKQGIKAIQQETAKAITALKKMYFSGGAFSSLGDAFQSLEGNDQAQAAYKGFKGQIDQSTLNPAGISSLAKSSKEFAELDSEGQFAVQQIIDKMKELKGVVEATDIQGIIEAVQKGFFLSNNSRALGNSLLGDSESSFELNKERVQQEAKKKEAEFLKKVFDEVATKQKEIYTEALKDYKEFSGAVDSFKENIDSFKAHAEEIKKGVNVNVELSEDAKKFFYEEIEKGVQNQTTGFNNNAVQGGA